MNAFNARHLHRFLVDCPLPLPSDSCCRSDSIDPAKDELKLSIHDLKDLSCQLALVRKREYFDLGDSVLICKKGCAMQLDLSGRHLKIYLPDAEHWPRFVKTFLNVGLAAVTYFRGELPLHAGAVSLDGQFFGVLAASGTGKSTLIWSLVQSGALFGNDDLVTVRVGDDSPIAMPSVSLFPKLCAPSLVERADDTPTVELYPGSGEFWMQIKPNQRLTEAQKLRCLFALEPDDSASQIKTRRWSKEEAAVQLPKHLHGNRFGQSFVGPKALQNRLMKLAEETPIYSLHYPKKFDQIPFLIETMRLNFS